MSGMLDQMAKDAEKQRQEDKAKEIENQILQRKLADATPSAEAGENAIKQDDNAISVFAHLLANQMVETAPASG